MQSTGKVCRPLERQGPNSANSSGERRTGAKVVQLPREWLGPSEDLVPFGVSADDAPPSPATPPASISPPSAQSFWTEDAASLHAALQGAPPADENVESGLTDGDEILPPAEHSAPPPRWVPRPRRRPRFRSRAFPALALSGLAAATFALFAGVLGSAPRATTDRSPSSGARLAPLTADLGGSAAAWRLLARIKKANFRAAAHSPKQSTKPTRAGRGHAHRHASSGAAPPSTYRSIVTYHPTRASSTAVALGSTTSATPAAAPIHHSASSSESRVDTSKSRSSANPTPASLLGPGHCACG